MIQPSVPVASIMKRFPTKTTKSWRRPQGSDFRSSFFTPTRQLTPDSTNIHRARGARRLRRMSGGFRAVTEILEMLQTLGIRRYDVTTEACTHARLPSGDMCVSAGQRV